MAKAIQSPFKDAELEGKIKAIRNSHENYGYRRIYGALRAEGLSVNRKRVQRLVQRLGLQVTAFTRRSRKYYSYKGTVGKVAPNRLKRRFDTCIPHQKITTDTTEFKYYQLDEQGHLVTKSSTLIHSLISTIEKLLATASRKDLVLKG